jgi:predicted Zn-dependent protease with MMP-like domain
MTLEDFKTLVAEVGLSSVPERFRGKLKNVAFLIEDDVPKRIRREMAIPPDETLLGLYTGVPQTERDSVYGIGATMPDTITLFRVPILEAAEEDGVSVRQVVEETIWHEVAHHFGLSDDEVEGLEARR